MSTVIKINGVTVGTPRPVCFRGFVPYRAGGIPTASFEVRGGALPGLPDPYCGKSFSVDIGGTRYFTGDVLGVDPDYANGIGWKRVYVAGGLRNRGDKFRHVDSNTGLDTSVYNSAQDSQASDFVLARSGRTVGQILTDVLTMSANAAKLAGYGLGHMTFPAGVPTLPSATAADLAALTLVPQAPVYFGGEKFLSAVESFLGQWAPNHYLDVDPADGTLRVKDSRTFTAHTLTMGSDPIYPTPLRRDVSQCFQRVEVTGAPVAKMYPFLLNTTAGEAPFAHDGLTVAQAKTAFNAADYNNPGQAAGQATAQAAVSGGGVTTITAVAVGYGYTPSSTVTLAFTGGAGSGAAGTGTVNSSGQVTSYTRTAAGTGYTSAPTVVVPAPAGTNSDTGTCVCNSTTTVTLTSSNRSLQYPANYWDYSGTGREGNLFLAYGAGTGITTYDQVRVVANAALSPGGSALFTVDGPLPHLLFDSYRLTGLTKGASDVWRRYALPSWAAPLVTQQSTYPFSLNLAGNTSATLTSSAMGLVEWSSSGSPPYQQAAAGVTVDTASGTVLFAYPTFLLAGGTPAVVTAFVPINTGSNLAVYPADVAGVPQFAGTSNAREGLQDTLQVTLPAWRDPANATAMLAYAQELHASVCDAVIEGEVVWIGSIYSNALTMGIALNIAGTDGVNPYVTGWESGTIPALPVTECEVVYNRNGLSYTTIMRCSNRRARFGAEAFLRPDRTGVTFAWDTGATLNTGAAAVAAQYGSYDSGGNFRGGELQENLANTAQQASEFGQSQSAAQPARMTALNNAQAAGAGGQVVAPLQGPSPEATAPLQGPSPELVDPFGGA